MMDIKTKANSKIMARMRSKSMSRPRGRVESTDAKRLG